MITRPGVSIVIPNWNHEILLPRAILSALRAKDCLAEQGTAAEVIVIDDASRDGSTTLLRQLEAIYHARGLNCLLLKSNVGLTAVRNLALRHARYRYLTFLDADNELVPGNLPLFAQILEATGAAAAYGTLLVRTPAADYAHCVLSHETIQPKIFRGNYVDAFSILDRTQLVDSGDYETTYSALEDYELWLHLASNGRRIVFVPAVFGYYYALPVALSVDPQKRDSVAARLDRVFNQVKTRSLLKANTFFLRYHPALGYL